MKLIPSRVKTGVPYHTQPLMVPPIASNSASRRISRRSDDRLTTSCTSNSSTRRDNMPANGTQHTSDRDFGQAGMQDAKRTKSAGLPVLAQSFVKMMRMQDRLQSFQNEYLFLERLAKNLRIPG